MIRVPVGYTQGNQISLKSNYYTSATSGTVLFTTQATLIRNGIDAITSTANIRTSTNTAATVPGTPNVISSVTNDLTSSTGQINGVTVSAGDLIKIRITRDTATDTASSSVKLLADFSEVTYE
jgi:hypothetical protein